MPTGSTFQSYQSSVKCNRLCVSISDETNNKLNSLVDNTNKKIKALSKSAIVELALNKFFEHVNEDNVADELENSYNTRYKQLL